MSDRKLMEQIFNLKFTSKQLVRGSKRAEKDEKTEKLKVKKAIEKGNIDGAKIYAQARPVGPPPSASFGLRTKPVWRSAVCVHAHPELYTSDLCCCLTRTSLAAAADGRDFLSDAECDPQEDRGAQLFASGVSPGRRQQTRHPGTVHNAMISICKSQMSAALLTALGHRAGEDADGQQEHGGHRGSPRSRACHQ